MKEIQEFTPLRERLRRCNRARRKTSNHRTRQTPTVPLFTEDLVGSLFAWVRLQKVALLVKEAGTQLGRSWKPRPVRRRFGTSRVAHHQAPLSNQPVGKGSQEERHNRKDKKERFDLRIHRK